MTDSSQRRGIVLFVIALSLFSVMDAIAKWASMRYAPVQVAWARYFFNVFIMLALFAPSMGFKLVHSSAPGLQIARGLALGLSTLCFFSALRLMPLAEASTIAQIAPILVTGLAIFLLGEQPNKRVWVALCLSFTGVLLIMKPGFAAFTWASLLPLVTAFCFAAYAILTRKLSSRDPAMPTLFIGAVVATLLFSLVAPGYWIWPDSFLDWLAFLAMGAIGAYGHHLMVKAYAVAPVSTLAPYSYAQALSALLMGWLVFDHFPDNWSLLGMGLIVATGVMNAILSHRASRA
ncbi:MAG: DMT family transporter [Betaproteobacteria bacterium]|jgi:drug/metabolite transporter (DMT)-like permease|nr:DMT family transporter [Pseudomonadota bacterium]NBO04904.1 DMT family transporter [Betaproteobacteria bacterium]HAB47481.1 EamA/RhaT family transporter [Lautropia sp.]NBO96146.1 DMT family transporter [Betaproteobacteria bacterium]NBP35005.1 DMT family transporter [Betaproteobacteria bacterium]